MEEELTPAAKVTSEPEELPAAANITTEPAKVCINETVTNSTKDSLVQLWSLLWNVYLVLTCTVVDGTEERPTNTTVEPDLEDKQEDNEVDFHFHSSYE